MEGMNRIANSLFRVGQIRLSPHFTACENGRQCCGSAALLPFADLRNLGNLLLQVALRPLSPRLLFVGLGRAGKNEPLARFHTA